MRTLSRNLSIGAFAVVLLPGICGAVDGRSAPTESSPVVTVVPAKKAPTIDGVIAVGEYAGAARLGGFALFPTNQLAKDQSDVWVTFDDTALYVAFRLHFSAGKPKATCTGRDGKLWEDDAVEIFIQPDPAKWNYFQFMGNPAGALADLSSSGPNLKEFAWNGPWNYKAHVADGYWEGELSIPFSAFGMATPANGAAIGFNICRDQQLEMPVLSSWSPIRDFGFHNPISFGRMLFAASSPVAQVALTRDDQSRQVKLGGQVVNRTAASNRLTGFFEVRREDVVVLKKELNYTVAADSSCPVDVAVTAGYGDFTIVYSLKDAGSTLASQTGYVSYSSPLVIRKYFFHDKIGLSLPIAKESTATAIRYVVKEHGIAVASVCVDLKANPSAPTETLVDIAKLKAGRYVVTASVLQGDTEIQNVTAEFAKPVPPEWLNSQIGISDQVLPPWVPLQRTGDLISLWGRTYRFAGLPVPSEISSNGVKLLREPMVFETVANGRVLTWKTAPVAVVEEKPAKIVFKSVAKAGSLTLTGVTTVEYDGFMRVEMSVAGSKTDILDKLIMEIPFDRRTAELFFANTTESYPSPIWPYWPGGKNGLVPEREISGPFTPSVWLGNNHQGLWWFTEGAKGWANKDEKRVISIVPQSDKVILRIAFVDDPISLAEPLNLSFGLQATPVKKPGPYKNVWRGKLEYGTEKNVSVRTANEGRLKYPAKGNFAAARGSAHFWTTVDFDPDIKVDPALPLATYNQGLFNLSFANQNSLGLYWNIETRGMVTFISQKGTYPVLANCPTHFKKGEPHLISLSWGEAVSTFVDGKLISTVPYKGSLPDDLATATITLSGGFGINAIKVTDLPYDGSTKVAPSLDSHTLLLDTFFAMSSKAVTTAEKCAGTPGGMIEGKCLVTAGKVSFSSDTRAATVFDDWKAQGFDVIHFHEHWTESEGYPKTVKHAAELKSIVAAVNQAGMKIMLYLGFQLGDNAPEWKLYKDEIRTEPWIEGQGWKREDHIGYGISYAGQYANFMLYNMRKLITDYGVTGFYFDGTLYPPMDTNQWHGAGYLDRHGRLQPTWQVFAYRDFMKRIRTMTYELDPDFYIYMHASGGIFAPTAAFGDGVFSGEQYAPLGEAKGRSLAAVIDPDDYRAEIVGDQHGFPVDFLAYFDYQSYDALAFPHGNVPPKLVAKRLGIDLSTAEWHPYWDNAGIIKTPNRDIRVSFYRTKHDGVILVAANYAKVAADTDLVLDLAALGLSPTATARDLANNKPAQLGNGVLTLRMEPWLVTLIQVK